MAAVAAVIAGGRESLWFCAGPRAAHANLARDLAQAGRDARGQGGLRLQRIFVIAQVALTTVLFVAAGLLGNSLYKIISVDPGSIPSKLLFAIYLSQDTTGRRHFR